MNHYLNRCYLFLALLGLYTNYAGAQVMYNRMYTYPYTYQTPKIFHSRADQGVFMLGRQEYVNNLTTDRILRINNIGDTLYSAGLPSYTWASSEIYGESDGSFIVTGANGGNFFAARFLSNGVRQWTTNYAIGTGSSRGLRINKIAGTGTYEIEVSASTGRKVIIDTNGTTLSSYDFAATNMIRAAGTPYYLYTPYPPTPPPYDFSIVKLQLMDSMRNIIRQFNYSAASFNTAYEPQDYLRHSGGDYFLLADTGGSYKGCRLLRWDSAGALKFVRPTPSSVGVLRNSRMYETPEGNLLIVGQSYTSPLSYVTLMVVDTNATILSQWHHTSPQGWSFFPANTLRLADNSLITTGHYLFNNKAFGALLKTGPNGEMLSSYINGSVYFDANTNGQRDSLEMGIPMQKVFSPNTNGLTVTNADGSFNYTVYDTGSYVFYPDTVKYWKLNSLQTADTVHIAQYNTVDSVSFGFIKDGDVRDVRVDLNCSRLILNQSSLLNCYVINEGNTTQDSVWLTVDVANLRVQGAALPFDSLGNNLYRFYVGSLEPYNSLSFYVDCIAPIGFYSLNDIVCANAVAVGKFYDTVAANNIDTLCMSVLGPYDPNNKLVYPQGDANNYIDTATKKLTYQINFQNTGSSEAYHVKLIDTLEQNIKPESIRLLAYSHNVQYKIEDNILQFDFLNIMLPDSNTNEPASHGYVKFEVDLIPGLAAGARIKNFADIYFDFNSPIRTDTPTVILFNPLNTGITYNTADGAIRIFPNPAHQSVTIKYNAMPMQQVAVNVTSVTGAVVYTGTHMQSSDTIQLDVATWPAGVYLVNITGQEKSHTIKMIKN